MKITAVKCTPVRVPRPATFMSSLGAQSHSENAVVEIDTDAGITGIGEVSSIWGRRGVGESEVVNNRFAPLLLGRDPIRISEINALMDQTVDGSQPAKAGVEMALFDLVGRSLDTPVYNLLGGLVRDHVVLSHSLSMGTSQEVACRAAQLVAQGYNTLKLKIGQDADADRANVEAVRREVGSDVTLRVDANMGWHSVDEAVRNIQALEPFDLELVEQPLAKDDLDGMRQIREIVSVPIMADESVWTPVDALDCIVKQAVDVINIYVSEAGGLLPASKIFAIAEAAGIPCIIGSMPELGIGTAAQAHLALAMRNIGYASDVNGVVYHTDDVIHETLDIRDGKIFPPGGAGLGVTLDQQKVSKYRIV